MVLGCVALSLVLFLVLDEVTSFVPQWRGVPDRALIFASATVAAVAAIAHGASMLDVWKVSGGSLFAINVLHLLVVASDWCKLKVMQALQGRRG